MGVGDRAGSPEPGRRGYAADRPGGIGAPGAGGDLGFAARSGAPAAHLSPGSMRPGRERGSPPGSVSVLLQLLSRILRWRRLSPAQALSGVSVLNSVGSILCQGVTFISGLGLCLGTPALTRIRPLGVSPFCVLCMCSVFGSCTIEEGGVFTVNLKKNMREQNQPYRKLEDVG